MFGYLGTLPHSQRRVGARGEQRCTRAFRGLRGETGSGVILAFCTDAPASGHHAPDIDNLWEPVLSVLVNAKGWCGGRRSLPVVGWAGGQEPGDRAQGQG